MTDFHNQVEAQLVKLANAFSDFEVPSNHTEIVATLAQVTALIQTLVPEEDVLDSPIQQSWKLGGTDQVSFRHGFKVCRDIILSAIKGVKEK